MTTPPSSSRPKPRHPHRASKGRGNCASTDPASTTRIPEISHAQLASTDGLGQLTKPGSKGQSSKPTSNANPNPSPENGEARRSTLKPVRPSRFSIELTPERRERWQRAADIAIPDRERNLAPWLVPLIDMLAEMQIDGRDPSALKEYIETVELEFELLAHSCE